MVGAESFDISSSLRTVSSSLAITKSKVQAARGKVVRKTFLYPGSYAPEEDVLVDPYYTLPYN